MKTIFIFALLGIFSAAPMYAQRQHPQHQGPHREPFHRPDECVPRYAPSPIMVRHRWVSVPDDGEWYAWNGIEHRFMIQKSLQRYLDTTFGVYLWGSIESPTRLEIGSAMTLTRCRRGLKIESGGKTSYFNLFRRQELTYRLDETDVVIQIGRGNALIRLSDDYGNDATYRL
jgi:hypothetical protein